MARGWEDRLDDRRPSPDTKAAPTAVPAEDSSPPHPERPRRRPRRFNLHSGQAQTRGSSESRGGDTRPGCPARLARPSPRQLGPTQPPPFPAPPAAAAGARDPSTYWRERLGMFAELPPELAPFLPASGPALWSHRRLLRPPRRAAPPAGARGQRSPRGCRPPLPPPSTAACRRTLAFSVYLKGVTGPGEAGFPARTFPRLMPESSSLI